MPLRAAGVKPVSGLCFSVDAFGEFPPSGLVVRWFDRPRPPHAQFDAMVAASWAEACRAAEAGGVHLFNGELTRYLAHRVENGVLTIDVGPTDYMNFIGSNYMNVHRVAEFGWELYGNPIGTSAVLLSADGWLILGRRSERVACHPGYVHTFGGGLEARERRPDGTFDAFASTQRELNEELGLHPGDVPHLVCIGMIQDAAVQQPELIFQAELALNRDQLGQRLRPDDPHEEHTALLVCRSEPDAVVPFILAEKKFAPIAVGALCLFGRHKFGEQWYEEACRQLDGRL